MIGIVDYGVGNLGSILNMYRKLGMRGRDGRRSRSALQPPTGWSCRASARSTPASPGCATRASRQPLREAVSARGVPLLGICVGMQMLTAGSEEGTLPGLGLVAGAHGAVPAGQRPTSRCRTWAGTRCAGSAADPLVDGLRGRRRASTSCTRTTSSATSPARPARHGDLRPRFRRRGPARQRCTACSSTRRRATASAAPARQLRERCMSTLRPRVIPCLLLRNAGWSRRCASRIPIYLGDPINAVKIFNDKEVDELVVLDITATRGRARSRTSTFIAEFASECFMPLAYGGGIRTPEHVSQLFAIGVEKVVINTAAFGAGVVTARRPRARQPEHRRLDRRQEGPARRPRGLRALGHAAHQARPGRSTRAAWRRPVPANCSSTSSTSKARSRATTCRFSPSRGGCAHTRHRLRRRRQPRAHARRLPRAPASAALAAATMFVLHGKHRAPLISFPSPAEIATLRD